MNITLSSTNGDFIPPNSSYWPVADNVYIPSTTVGPAGITIPNGELIPVGEPFLLPRTWPALPIPSEPIAIPNGCPASELNDRMAALIMEAIAKTLRENESDPKPLDLKAKRRITIPQ